MYNKKIKKIRSIGIPISSLTLKKSRKLKKKPGEHSLKKKRGISTKVLYGKILKDKNYIQFLYCLKTTQLKKYLEQSKQTKNDICSTFFDLLELRLDNIVVKTGFAKTIPMARQLINHGFIFVNKNKIKTPGFSCKKNDIIESKFLYNKKNFIEYIVTKNKKKIIINKPSLTAPFLFNKFLQIKLKKTIEFFNK